MSDKKNWWDKLDELERMLLLSDAGVQQEQMVLDPDAYWGVRAADLADELREFVVEYSRGVDARLALLRLAGRIARLDGRSGTAELRAWQQGAKGTAVIAHRPHDGGHTEEFYETHRWRGLRCGCHPGQREGDPMTNGEKMIWAAVFGAEWLRARSDTTPSKRGNDCLESQALRAAGEANLAIQALRSANDQIPEEDRDHAFVEDLAEMMAPDLAEEGVNCGCGKASVVWRDGRNVMVGTAAHDVTKHGFDRYWCMECGADLFVPAGVVAPTPEPAGNP